jgi:hypothetical protein
VAWNASVSDRSCCSVRNASARARSSAPISTPRACRASRIECPPLLILGLGDVRASAITAGIAAVDGLLSDPARALTSRAR